MLNLSIVILAFIIISENKGLGQWAVIDATVDASVIAGFGTANGLLGTIDASAATTAEQTVQLNEFMIANFGTIGQALADKDIALTQAPIALAQASTEGDKLLSVMVIADALKGKASALAGGLNSTAFGKQVYPQTFKLPPISPALAKLPGLMTKYTVLEGAVNHYYLVVNENKPAMISIQKDLNAKLTALESATTPAQVEKIHAAISVLNTQMSILQAENQEAAKSVEVIALANENNEKKQADLSALNKQAEEAQTALVGVLTMANETWD